MGLQSSPLIESVKNGDIERVKVLLKSKVNINEKDSVGNTALRLASKNGHKE
ncbi:ankyrin repeat domain-containing protein [Leptospira bandrabouensis]|uniref:ankyrin repeat domain-containing protein n=1 Tax=Leptospira bandrabouensis TaxID=2484903 RepID=UPI003B8A5B50